MPGERPYLHNQIDGHNSSHGHITPWLGMAWFGNLGSVFGLIDLYDTLLLLDDRTRL
jgi:hypothetical protein